jgi:hypothetical protein
MHRRTSIVVCALLALVALGLASSSALAAPTVTYHFEYDSPGLTFEAQHVGPAHCKGKYQTNAKRFPGEIETQPGAGEGFMRGGGREVVICRSKTRAPLETNIAPGEPFPLLNPAADYWVSEWFNSFNPGLSCFTISLPNDRVHGKITQRGHAYKVIAYLEFTRECHLRG